MLQWALDHMWNEQGFFYYRILRSCTIRTSYMRWTQAWMFLALSMLLSESAANASPEKVDTLTAPVETSAC